MREAILSLSLKAPVQQNTARRKMDSKARDPTDLTYETLQDAVLEAREAREKAASANEEKQSARAHIGFMPPPVSDVEIARINEEARDAEAALSFAEGYLKALERLLEEYQNNQTLQNIQPTGPIGVISGASAPGVTDPVASAFAGPRRLRRQQPVTAQGDPDMAHAPALPAHGHGTARGRRLAVALGALVIGIILIFALVSSGTIRIGGGPSLPQGGLQGAGASDELDANHDCFNDVTGVRVQDRTCVPVTAPVESMGPVVPAAPTPAPTEDPRASDIGENFTPERDYQQSCEPERREGCTWDPGVERGKWVESLRRYVYTVGIIKGVRIEWAGGVARQFVANDGEARCSLVVIPPSNWHEDITIWDANVSTYYVWAGDVEGWMKTLAVQAAFEQHENYGCPEKTWPQDFDIWASGIPSPPDGTWDQIQVASVSTQPTVVEPVVTEPKPRVEPAPKPANPGADQTCRHDTVNCKERKQTSDFGGKLNFQQGAAVLGSKIVINGREYGPCFFRNAPNRGYVIDGVVNYWEKERKDQHLRAC